MTQTANTTSSSAQCARNTFQPGGRNASRRNRNRRRYSGSPYIRKRIARKNKSSILLQGMTPPNADMRFSNYYDFMPLNVWLSDPSMKKLPTWDEVFDRTKSLLTNFFGGDEIKDTGVEEDVAIDDPTPETETDA